MKTKYLIYIPIILLLLTSCKGPQRITDSQEVKVNDQTQVDTKETHESKSELEVSTSKIIEEAESIVTITETKTKTTEYDNDKPVNPDTGKPPVKSEAESESKTTQTINRGKKTQEETSAAASDTTSYEKTDNSKKDIQVETKEEHSEKKQLPSIFWWAVSIVLVGILALIFWSKISTWLKSLFTK